MVAEAHSRSDVEIADVIEFIVNVVAQLGIEEHDGLLLVDCGFCDTLEIEALAKIVSEEYGERTLIGEMLDSVDDSWTLTEFAQSLLPGLNAHLSVSEPA